ncbi:hypothetical protein BATDEDRAFT_24207 [Batrachochytrium dendrobatidis JAM81]|uniref:Tail specific protease domain-containing protein n=2 Tax=Batrachochytrium dendrobatidis TaxID=109871 RepID=F4P0R7_BATDJ|nr:uncharacterized protein BATDEDRAFT_24207 [Batrachochytrium dendrobatidis JAM81]EGF81640.1 hypothetical protein BATDEDRAFT_24207 [Batrachochytrium dendrobatidis JAM81]|eukprot:XP_006677933.1 hypothetical protein BATDEDRAFT_24207 [Batrachochytrium dendrobatidis JAM81]
MPYTSKQQSDLLDSVENGLKMWVNYESKIKNYGERADPFPIIKKLREKLNASVISDTEIQTELMNAFNRMRDLNTRFQSSGPHTCFFATTGLFFKFIEGDADMLKKPTVVFQRHTSSKSLRAFFGKTYDQINVGDELLFVDDLPFVDYWALNQDKTGGSNDYAGQRGALNYMSYRSGDFQPMPKFNSVRYQLKSAKSGKKYRIYAPWAVGFDPKCWNITSTLYATITKEVLPGTANYNAPKGEPFDTESNVKVKRHVDISKPIEIPLALPGNYREKQNFARIMDESSLINSALEYHNTSVSGVTWAIWKPESKNLGVIKLSHFLPFHFEFGRLGVEEAIFEIHNLLSTVLKDTNAIVFDVRGNTGGMSEFANGILQFFKPDFQPMQSRFLMNKLTYSTLVNGTRSFDTAIDAWNKTPPGSKYSIPYNISSFDKANLYGQAYLKPVAALTDATCRSECDLFVASLQSSETGYVFGEDGTTGGAGADVFKLDPLLMFFDPTDFKKMPYFDYLSTGNGVDYYTNTFSIGVRQVVRNGKHQGQQIEDVGVISDYIVRPRLADILPGSTENSQLDRIADQLKTLGEKTGQNNLHFASELIYYDITGSDVDIDVEVQGIDELSAIDDSTGKVLSVAKFKSDIKSQHKFELKSVINDLGNNRISIIGKAKGKQVLKAYKQIRREPKPEEYFKLERGVKWSINSTSKSVGVYNSLSTDKSKGWNSMNGTWVIGDGVKYSPGIFTELTAYFSAPVDSDVDAEFNFTLQTQQYGDYLSLNVKTGEKTLSSYFNTIFPSNTELFPNGISGVDGGKSIVPFTVAIEKASISFLFRSDLAVEMKGATVGSFTLTLI